MQKKSCTVLKKRGESTIQFKKDFMEASERKHEEDDIVMEDDALKNSWKM